MALNIKNQETEDMINKLAKETGQTLTGAVKSAVKDALNRVDKNRKNQTDEVLKLCKQFQHSLTAPLISTDVDSLLYDESGAPK